MTSFDAIVIGGGHNGLVAATLLAKSGRKVCVVEADAVVGGAARTEEFAPGFRASTVHLLNRLHPQVVSELELERHGLDLDPSPAPTVAFDAKSGPLVLRGAYGETVDGVDPVEARAWRDLRARLLRQANVLKPFLTRRPPDLGALSLADKVALGAAAISLRRLGRDEMREFLRMVLMNVADIADEHLADDRLKGLLGFDATLGSHLGPMSPTSLLGLYYRLAGEVAGAPGAQILPKGGMGAVVDAIASAAVADGVAIRTDASVARILLYKGAAVGVALAGGEELTAPCVVSAINPRTTLLELVGPRALDIGFVRKVGHIRMDGDVAKLNLALDRPPEFDGVADADLRGRIVIAPSTGHVERAFNPSKYGEFSPEPVMEITLPSLADPSLAPDGACVLSALVQYAPYRLREGWAAGKPKLQKAIMAVLEACSPGIGKTVRHAELLTPADIETRYRMPGGHWHHGELQADQMLFSRPVAGHSGYDTPVPGLYLCGAGSHPGGGVSGVPGLNAARHIMAREKA
jgi:phytoene dehydrogenase-like protein